MDSRAIPTDLREYNKAVALIKSRVQRWPSAYASGMVVIEYKRTMKKKGLPAYSNDVLHKNTSLARWFNEKWVDILTGKPCGTVHTYSYYPTCRPSKRISSKSPMTLDEMTQVEKKRMISLKQKAGPKRLLMLSS